MENKVSQFVSIDKKEGAKANPLVSIITPVLNGVKYLETCIQSVLNQSYPYIEHVFVDGGSTDGTVEMLASYQTMYPDRIKFISEQDKGTGTAWNGAVDATNKGWKMAKGGIFGWLGSDDMYEPDAVLTVVEFFRSNHDAYFVFGDCNVINEVNEVIGKLPTKDFDLKKMINDSCHVHAPAAFYKREVIEKVGFWDTRINSADFDYWIRVGKVFQIHRIEKVLSNFRIHKDSTSGSKEAFKMYAREGYIISRKYGGHIYSRCAIRYFRCVIVEWLRPVLGPIYPIYPFIKRVAYPFIKRVVRRIRL